MAEISPAGTTPTARSVRTRRAVLDATAELLSDGGLAAATVDAIRDRSGVSKTTIYKHWPNRLCVAIDAFTDRLASDAALPDTGTAQGDFAEQFNRLASFYSGSLGRGFGALLAHALSDPIAAQWLNDRLLASREHGIAELWQRAVARGELSADIDPELAIDLLFGPVMWRLLSGRTPLTADGAAQLASLALHGLLKPELDRPPG